MKKTLCILCLIGMLLLMSVGCDGFFPVAEAPTPVPVAETPYVTDAPEDPDVIEIIETPVPTPEPTPEPTEAPTEEPTPEPSPTRAPKAGDVATVNFPNYDTGADADYSYQSDELRIAIRITKDEANSQTYYVADIWIRSLDSFRTIFAKGGYNKGTEEGDVLAKRENAIFAVNGNYNQGLSLHAGKVYKKTRTNKGWNSCAVCLLYKDGTMKTFKLGKEKFDINAELKNGAWHGWQFGPVIIRDYEIDPQATLYSIGYKARNMIGYYEPGHYVIVTCDAGRKDAQGMNEDQMAALMKSLNVKEAFNLDGGTSAVMVFMGKVINHPTMRNDNGKKVSGRPLKDMLLFGEYDENGVSPDLSTLSASKLPE